MKLSTVIPYLKKIQIYKSRDTLLKICWHRYFFTGNQQLKLYQEIQIQASFYYEISNNSFNFFESLKVFLINIATILMIPAKLVTLGLFKIKTFWNRGYDVKIFVQQVTNRILLHDSNYFVDVVIWPKFDKSSISIREVIITSIL